MSVLDTPRIYFRGETTFDPVTTNNYPRNYDEMGAQSVVTPDGGIEAFRKAAVDDVTTNGNWNPHGTYRSRFFDTRIVGFDLGSGTRTDDPFVGAPVSFLGMLVDLEPFGSTSSQLFFDEMSFGIDGGCQVLAQRAMRMIARQINFARNPTYSCIAGVASVVWQTSFPKGSGLPIHPRGSAAIEALAKALEDDDILGLTVRWNAYRTIYYDDLGCRNGNDVMKAASRALQDKLRNGGFQPNPARSRLVGVLGLWRKGEAPQVIGDRALLQAPKSPIATATARLNGRQLVLDLANSVPETGPDLAKTDYGPLQILAGGQVVATIPPTDYNQQAYEASAGIVTCTLPDDATVALARSADLVLQDSKATVYLKESPFHVCEITPNTYLDPGESSVLQVQVLNRGLPAGAGVPVQWISTSTSAPTQETTLTDAQGVASLTVTGATSNAIGQIDCYVASTDTPPPTSVNTLLTSYLWVRTLPSGSDIAGLSPTWKNVYQHVLYNWHAMAPCMDNWLKLDNEAQVAAYGPLIRQLTSKDSFEAQRYMPVTRDLTAGQRSLLYAWLDAQTTTPRPASARPNPLPQPCPSRFFRSGHASPNP